MDALKSCLRASELLSQAKDPTWTFSFGIEALDQALGGGLKSTWLVEWGMPPGRGGRELIANLLARATNSRGPQPCSSVLWVQGGALESSFYPPAWAARGLNLDKTFILRSDKPLEKLRALFEVQLFPLIVIDRPGFLKAAEWLYLAQSARLRDSLIIVLQPYFLSKQKSHPGPRLRFNTSLRDHTKAEFDIHCLKGPPHIGPVLRL